MKFILRILSGALMTYSQNDIVRILLLTCSCFVVLCMIFLKIFWRQKSNYYNKLFGQKLNDGYIRFSIKSDSIICRNIDSHLFDRPHMLINYQTSGVFRLPLTAEMDDVTTHTMQIRLFRSQNRTKFGQGKGHHALHTVSCFIYFMTRKPLM